MKTLILLAIPFIVFASGESMRIFEHMSLYGSNHRPSIKLIINALDGIVIKQELKEGM